MSNPAENKSGEEKIAELLEVVDRILEIVKTETSSNNTTKLKITLQTHLNQLTDRVNTFFSDYTLSSKKLMDTTISVMQSLNEILQYLPRKELYLTWLNYMSMNNFIRSNLATIHHETDLSKSLSNAGTLSQILIGEVETIKEIPKMPPPSEPVQYFDHFVPQFNAIQSTISLYHMLIDSLPIVNYDDFVEWMNAGIWHYKLLWDLIATYDIPALLRSKKVKNIKNFYNNALNTGITVASSSYLFATIFEKINHFPDEIDDQGLLPSKTINGFIGHINKIITYMEQIEDEIQEAYDNFLVNRNDKLQEADYYGNYQLVKDDMRMTIKLLKFDQEQAATDIEKIEPILSKYEQIMADLVDEVGGLEKTLDSHVLASLVDILKDKITFVAAKAVAQHSTTVLEDFLFKYRRVIQAADITEFAEFHYIRILCILHVYTRIAPDQLDLVDYFQELNLAKENFVLNPRLYIGVNLLLIQLVELGIALADRDLFEHNIRETVSQNFVFSTYSQEIELYLLYLQDPTHIDISDLRYRKEHLPLDLYTWIYPDWSKLSSKLEFIPFSRLKDTVLKLE